MTDPKLIHETRLQPSTTMLLASHPRTPEESAAAIRIGARYGVSPAAADSMLRSQSAIRRQQVELGDAPKLLDRSPTVRQWLGDRSNAGIAQDDTGSLLGLMDASRPLTQRTSWLGDVYEGARGGFVGLGAHLGHLAIATGRPTDAWLHTIAEANRDVARSAALRSADLAAYYTALDEAPWWQVVPRALAEPGNLMVLVAENLGFMAPSLALGGAMGLATGGNPFAMGGGAFAGSSLAEFGAWVNAEMAKAGYDTTDVADLKRAYGDAKFLERVQGEAVRKGLFTGAADALLTVVGGRLLGRVGKDASILAKAKAATVEGLSQGLGEGASEAVGQLGATGRVDMHEAALEAVAGLGAGAARIGMGSMARRARERVAQVSRATEDVEVAKRISGITAASKIAERAPSRWRDLVRAMAGDRDAVLVDREAWAAYHAARDADPARVAEEMGVNSRAWAESERSGFLRFDFATMVGAAAKLADADQDAFYGMARFREDGPTLAEAAAEMESIERQAEDAARAAASTTEELESLRARLVEIDAAAPAADAEATQEAPAPTGLEGLDPAQLRAMADTIEAENAVEAAPETLTQTTDGETTGAPAPEGGGALASILNDRATAPAALRALADQIEAPDTAMSERAAVEARIAEIEAAQADLDAETLAIADRARALFAGKAPIDAALAGDIYAGMLRAMADLSGLPIAEIERLFPLVVSKGKAQVGGVTMTQASALPESIDVDGVQRPTLNSEGRPIAATEDAVRNFWRWFGDSKVVDAQGRPLVFAHSTNAPAFTEFRTSGLSAHFGTVEAALDRAKTLRDFSVEIVGRDHAPHRVELVYLRVENPLEMPDLAALTQTERGEIVQIDEVADSDEYAHPMSWESDEDFQTWLVENGTIEQDEFWDVQYDKDAAVGLLRDQGYDGIEYENAVESPGSLSYVVFSPGQIKSALGNAGTFDPASPSILFQTAFHGTPHRFDKFDISKVGTGEGNQAFGWGLYFADKKAVAKVYRENLSPSGTVYDFSAPSASREARDAIRMAWNDAGMHLAESGENDERVLASMKDDLIWRLSDDDGETDAQDIMALRDGIEAIESGEVSVVKHGSLLTVDLAPAEDDYLLWDVPISQQSEKVKAALDAMPGFEMRDRWKESGAWPDHITGEGAYRELAGGLTRGAAERGLPEAASRALLAAGIPGIKYLDGGSRTAGDGTYNYVLFDDSLVKVLKVEQSAKGSLSFTPDDQSGPVTPRIFTLAFLQSADASTFVHEGAHYWLEMLRTLARHPDAKPEVSALWTTVREELGVAEGAELTVEHHELFARLHEAWWIEGRAPTSALRQAFAAFTEFLARIYDSILGVEREHNAWRASQGLPPQPLQLTDGLRDVFARMHATEAEIQAARYEMGADGGLPEDVLAAIDATERDAYERLVAEARRAAAAGAHEESGRIVETLKRRLRSARLDQLRERALAAMDAQPAVQALYRLRDGTQPNGEPLGEDAPPVRILSTTVEDDALRGRLAVLGVLTEDVHSGDAAPFADIAAAYGYEDHAAFVGDMEQATGREKKADAIARTMLRAESPELMTAHQQRDVARRAHTGRERIRQLEDELRILWKLATDGEDAAARRADKARNESLAREARMERRLEDARRREAGTQAVVGLERQRFRDAAAARRQAFSPGATIQFLRARAKVAIAAIPTGSIRPNTYLLAAGREARKSASKVRAGKFVEAAQAKERELYDIELYREARRVVAEADKHQRFFERIRRPGTQRRLSRSGNYTASDMLAALSERFGLGEGTEAQRRRYKTLEDYLRDDKAARARAGDHREIDVAPELLDERFRAPWGSITIQQARDVREAAQSVYGIATSRDKVFREGKYASIQDEAAAVAAQIAASKPRRADADRLTGAETLGDKALDQIDDVYTWLSKMPVIARMMDGDRDGGPVTAAFAYRANDMQTTEADRTVQVDERLRAMGEMLPDWNTADFKRRAPVPGLTIELSHEQRLAAAFLYGNEIGRNRLEVIGLNESSMKRVLATLTAEDVAFLNAMYEYHDSWQAEIAAKELRTSGTEPEWVAPVPYDTPAGRVRGGYHPQKYSGTKGREHSVAEIADAMKRGAATKATTRRGYTKARIENFAGRVRLDLGVLTEHYRELVHDLTHHEGLIDMNRLLAHRDVREAIEARYGAQTYRRFQSMLEALATGDVPAKNAAERILTLLRVNTSTSILGFKVMTGIPNVTGLFQSARRIGWTWMWKGMQTWLGSAQDQEYTGEWIKRLSPFMRQRAENAHTTLHDIHSRLTDPPRTWFGKAFGTQAAWREWGWSVIVATQVFVDRPTWVAQYLKSTSEGMSQADAVRAADQAVRDTQGSSQMQDLAEAQRSGPIWKLFTVFYFYMSTTFGQTSSAVGAYKRSPAGATRAVKLALDLMTLYYFPALAIVAMRYAMRGGEEEPDEIPGVVLAESVDEMLGNMLGVLPVGREFASAIQGFDYQGPAGLRIIPESVKFGRKALELDADAGMRKSLLNVVGSLTGIPSGQINATLDGIDAIGDKDVTGLRAILAPVVGAPYRERR